MNPKTKPQLKLFVDENSTHGDVISQTLQGLGVDAEIVQRTDKEKNGPFLMLVNMDMVGSNDLPILMAVDDKGYGHGFVDNLTPGSENYDGRIAELLRSTGHIQQPAA